MEIVNDSLQYFTRNSDPDWHIYNLGHAPHAENIQCLYEVYDMGMTIGPGLLGHVLHISKPNIISTRSIPYTVKLLSLMGKARYVPCGKLVHFRSSYLEQAYKGNSY